MNLEEDLRMEIKNLKDKVKSNNRTEQILKFVGLIATLATILAGVLNYSDAKQKEFRKEFWEKRFMIYNEVTDLASAIALAENLDSVKSERLQFWKLYWGRLSILEDKEVLEAMLYYGEQLSTLEKQNDNSISLKNASYRLARACRISLKETWEPVVLDDIGGR